MPYKNREDKNAQGRRWYAKNREKVIYGQMRGRKENPHFRSRAFKEEMKRLYGITPEQRLQMLVDQNYKCKICADEITWSSSCLDHIHGTKIIRGLLCHSCNLGIGKLKDSILILERAYLYVKNSGNI